MQQPINQNLTTLINQVSTLKQEMDMAIKSGKSFVEVKAIHLQIKELSKLVEAVKDKTGTSLPANVNGQWSSLNQNDQLIS